ncbi:class I SAM-dependent methyltransferase [soil metagenome]
MVGHAHPIGMSNHYRAIAEYYDAEYASKEMLQHDVPFFMEQLPKSKQSVLDLACGTGRASIPIAQAGHRVVGVDYAADMLAIAKRKRDGVGLTDGQLNLKQQNCLKLRLNEKFDWITIFFNTFLAFTTLEQQDAVLAGVRKHLKPRGRFWLDIFQPNLDLLAKPVSKNVDSNHFYVDSLERAVLQQTDVRRDQATQCQHVTFRYQWFDASGREHREKISFDMTFMFPRELQLLLERNGLKIEAIFGDYDGSPLSPDSPRMIAKCRLA